MKTFEYKILPHIVREDELNELGKQGWDLVVAQYGGKLILKRELESSLNQEPHKSLTASSGIER
jgi:hypothetical protein